MSKKKAAALTTGPSPRGRGESELLRGEGEAAFGRTLTPGPSPRGRGESESHYRGGFRFSGLIEQAKELRRRQTPAEELLWQLLRGRKFLGLKFRRQHQIGTYIADFYCHEARLIVELDGGFHRQASFMKKDGWRDENLQALGFRTVRIPNEMLLERPHEALEKLQTLINTK